MNKEKLKTLEKYKTELLGKLSDDVPPKHVNRPKEYKNFLKHELDMVSKKIDNMRLNLGNGK